LGHTQDFFKTKKGWSVLKDQIIDHYLEPYIAKILTTRKPLVIVDCFAGKGKFDDGSPGSPLIIAQHISKTIDSSKSNKQLQGIFIEKKYHKELTANLNGYRNCLIWPGTFEDNLSKITQLNPLNNLFVYIDPYGIKSLDFRRFSQIKQRRFNTLEMLINFNSFGFLREGCRLLKCENLLQEIDDYDDYEIDYANDIENMNHVANGDYWIPIVRSLQNKEISMLEAEEKFTKEYVWQIESLFRYVVNIPIKQKSQNVPKYRLIFGTNNQDGLILMADNMNKKWKQILENQRHGQEVLFEYDFPDLSLQNDFDLEEDIVTIVKGNGGSILLKELIVKIIQKYGISFSESQYKKVISNMPLRLHWNPEFTETGRRVTSLDYNKYEIRVIYDE